MSVTDSEEHNGQGGSSYISELGRDVHYEPGMYHSGASGRIISWRKMTQFVQTNSKCEFLSQYNLSWANSQWCRTICAQIIGERGLCRIV